MLIKCPNCNASYHIEPPPLPRSGRVRCTRCRHVWSVKSVQIEIAECDLVDDALQRLKAQTNGWKIISAVPSCGPIGFALEVSLYNHLAHPADNHVPTGAAGLCVFHKEFCPRDGEQQNWQIGREKFDAYEDGDDRNSFLQRAEEIVQGTPVILYAHAMEIACRRLLRSLEYDVRPFKRSGKPQNGIDVLGVKHDSDDDEEEDGRVIALECKTTMQGFVSTARRILVSRVLSSLKMAHDHDAVCRLYDEIAAHAGDFDYLFVTNRNFKRPRNFRARDGSFILRGIQVG